MPKNSGYKTKLQYQQTNKNNQNKKKRKCNIIWFYPPNSKSSKTNIGRIFIKLISKYFPPNHKFVKIFNKNNRKLSYSCMPNIRSKINSHKYSGNKLERHKFSYFFPGNLFFQEFVFVTMLVLVYFELYISLFSKKPVCQSCFWIAIFLDEKYLMAS